MIKRIPKKGSNSEDTSDDDNSHSGRGSSNSSTTFSDSGHSSTGLNQTTQGNPSPNTSVAGITLTPGMEITTVIIIYREVLLIYITKSLQKVVFTFLSNTM